MKLVDIVCALVMLVLSAVTFLATRHLPYWSDFAPGSAFGPFWVAASGVIISVLLVLSTPSITVTRTTLKVGRATIDRGFLGMATAFRGKEATAERGTRLNGLAFLCIRGWVDPVVRIEIEDPSDRTPYWLTSTRHPEQLIAALNS